MKRLMKIVMSCLAASSLFMSSFAFSWNANGHMLIANIAYQKLTPKARQEIDQMVAHFQVEYAYIDSFAKLSTWPDSIRSQKIEAYTHWHYVDVAFSDDGSPLQSLLDSDNALWATKIIANVVKNKKANPYERERFLSFLIHVVGDIHQPLHTVSRISANHLEGDRGGNSFEVYQGQSRTNLHKLWDGGVGSFSGKLSSVELDAMAQNLISRYSVLSFGLKAEDTHAENWVKEGMWNAKNYVYSIQEGQTLSNEYVTAGQGVAQQQVVLAGYRLAALLNSLLG